MMRALVKEHFGEDGLKMKELPIPEPAANEVRVKIAYSGICGTDLHIKKDEFPAGYPVTIGHEFSGIIDALGSDVSDFQIGERVVAFTSARICGKCAFCRSGLYMLCSEKKGLGSFINGSFAEYMVIPARCVLRIPENISFEEAALGEPLACTVRMAIEQCNIKAGHYVYVAGPGPIGQIMAQLAKISGAHVTVAGTTQDKDRLALAKQLGADETIDVLTEDVEKRAQEITYGHGYDIVFECSGNPAAADTCVSVLRKTGTFAQMGLYGKPVMKNMDTILFKESPIVFSYSSEPSSWEILFKLWRHNKLNVKPLISAIIPFDEWEKAFAMAENKEGYKILVKINDMPDIK